MARVFENGIQLAAGGSVFLIESGGVVVAVDSNGTPSPLIDSATAKYTPTTPANWTDPDPTNVKAALDRLAAGLVPGGVFGQNYQTAISTARSTTTSTTFTAKVTLTTPALTGTYRVGWCAVVDSSDSNFSVEARLQNTTNAVTIGTADIHSPHRLENRMHVGGFAEVVFSGALKAFVIQYRITSTATAGIQDARIEIWRVA